MSSTFATRLTGSDGRDLRLALVIQGVPFVFQQGRADLIDAVVALAGYGAGDQHTRFKGVGKIEQAAKELDLVARRMVGGSLAAELHDDDDGTLQALFAPRRRRSTFLVADVDASPGSDTLEVDDAASIGTINVPTTIYVGGETIGFAIPDDSPTPDEVVGTRGAFGSEAQAHFGAADNGAGVYVQPPSWIGRRVKLIGYFEKDDGTTTAALAMVLDTFRLEEAPRYTGNGRWSLQASHLSDEVAKRKLGSGQRDVGAEDYNDGDLAFNIKGGANRFVVGGVPTWVRIRGQSADSVHYDVGRAGFVVNNGVDSAMITELVSAAGLIITVRGQNLVEGSPNVVRAVDLRHIAILSGIPAGLAVLYALLSRFGDGANDATYDKLPGLDRTANGTDGWAFGAGIRSGEVDTEAFLDVGNDAGTQWSFVIDDEIELGEMLRDFCLATDSIWLVDRDGQLTVKRLSEERAASVLTIDDDVIIGEPTVDFVEEDIAPRVRLVCNWDTISGKFLAELTVIDSELATRYPDHHERLEIESRGICLTVGSSVGTHKRPAISPDDAQLRLRRLQKEGERGRILVSCVCHLDALLVDLGDVVVVSVDVPDLEGDLIADRTARVLKIGPKTDAGRVELAFELFEPLLAIAPAAVITGLAADVVTLEASKDGTATPARMFAVGWTVEQRAADGTYLADFSVIAIPTDTTLQLSAAPAGVTLNSDFLVLTEQAAADSSAATNTDELGLRDFTYQMPDSEADIVNGSVAGGVANAETRWR